MAGILYVLANRLPVECRPERIWQWQDLAPLLSTLDTSKRVFKRMWRAGLKNTMK